MMFLLVGYQSFLTLKLLVATLQALETTLRDSFARSENAQVQALALN